MKTEEWLAYRRMYADMEDALGTPWLRLGASWRRSEKSVDRALSSRTLREDGKVGSFQPANEEGDSL